MNQWFILLVALSKYHNLIDNTNAMWITIACNPSSQGFYVPLWPMRTPHSRVHIHIYRYIYTNKLVNIFDIAEIPLIMLSIVWTLMWHSWHMKLKDHHKAQILLGNSWGLLNNEISGTWKFSPTGNRKYSSVLFYCKIHEFLWNKNNNLV